MVKDIVVEARGLKDPPASEALDEVLEEREELYRCRLPEGLRVPILVHQLDIVYGISTEAEVDTAVKGMKGGRLGGPPGIRTEDLKEWLREATRKRDPARTC